VNKLAVCVLAAVFVSGCDLSRGPSPVSPTTVVAEGDPAPGAPTSVFPGTGPEVVAYVASRYPERLAAGVSHAARVANMEFLRDRIIEAGLCGGMTLAWNLKRGVGPRSIDAIDWRHGAEDINDVVDLASDYENTSIPLRLHWIVVAGPAGWDPYPQPTCR
jgi:hypothetical protein